jgi:hypothetical protein
MFRRREREGATNVTRQNPESGVVGLALASMALETIARLGWRARTAASTPRDRALILGALAAGLALLLSVPE